MYLVADDFVHDAIGAADFLCHGVEREALGAGDGALFEVTGPGGEHEPPRALDLQAVGLVEQEEVAVSGVGSALDFERNHVDAALVVVVAEAAALHRRGFHFEKSLQQGFKRVKEAA